MRPNPLSGASWVPDWAIPDVGQRQWIGPWLRRAWWHMGAGPAAVARHEFPGVLVLAYHGVRPSLAETGLAFAPLHVREDLFASHCDFFRRHCRVISGEDWLGILRREQPIPPRAVLLTFDDGYRSVLTHGVPLLREFGLPGVFFVCSGPARAGQLHWYDAVARRGGEEAMQNLRGASYADWRAAVAQLDLSCDSRDPLAVMSPGEIATLAGIPGMTIGAHTAWHPRLAAAPRDCQRHELVECAQELRTWIGRDVRLLAYPTGRRPADYDDISVQAARDAGFACAFTTENGFAHPDRPSLEQPRYTVVDGLTVPELAYRLTYLWR